ncbi:MAG: hypothetical protein A2Y21_05710, partial [Clostridiales bacterium GWC2_40_7]
MVYIYTFIEVDKNIKNDSLSDFMNEMTFIPHAFGYQCNNPGAVCSDRITGDFELICIVGGESRITIDSTLYICSAGDAVLIPPFTMHKIQTPASNPHENYWIHFDLNPFHMQKNFITAILGDTGNKLHPGLTKELLALYQLLENEYQCERSGRMHFVSSILVQIIIEVLRLKNSPSLTKNTIISMHPSEAEIVRKSLDFIQDNLLSPIVLANIANYLHISESYLFKSFSVIMQMPPNQFIQFVKMKKAEQLLKSTHHSIKEISEMLGFSSPYYFSNVYKK